MKTKQESGTSIENIIFTSIHRFYFYQMNSKWVFSILEFDVVCFLLHLKSSFVALKIRKDQKEKNRKKKKNGSNELNDVH